MKNRIFQYFILILLVIVLFGLDRLRHISGVGKAGLKNHLYTIMIFLIGGVGTYALGKMEVRRKRRDALPLIDRIPEQPSIKTFQRSWKLNNRPPKSWKRVIFTFIVTWFALFVIRHFLDWLVTLAPQYKFEIERYIGLICFITVLAISCSRIMLDFQRSPVDANENDDV